MNKRIERISSYIFEDDLVADIGCDQALLSEILAKRNIYSVASDIKESIVINAKNRLKELKLDKYQGDSEERNEKLDKFLKDMGW